MLLAVSALLPGAEFAPGTVLEVRLDKGIGSGFSKRGDVVRASVVAPLTSGGLAYVPAGARLTGHIVEVRKLGLAFRRQTALLDIDFDTLTLPWGESFAVSTRLAEVETAKEMVAPGGRIRGIRPTANVSANLATYAWRLTWIEPHMAVPVWFIKGLFAPVPDPEIRLPAGAELRLRLRAPLRVETGGAAPAARLSEAERAAAVRTLRSLPSQQVRTHSGKASDLVNVALLGSEQQVARAFTLAGWNNADPRTTGTVLKSYFSVVKRAAYASAPMSKRTLDGDRPDFELQKNLNSIAKRHHLRMWQRETAGGQLFWVMAATEDTGVSFSRNIGIFTHQIDGEIDIERAKVVNDLVATGCVAAAGLVDRQLPANLDNGAGVRLLTDGRVAVVKLGDCTGAAPARETESASRVRRAASSVRRELARSNIVNLGFNSAMMTTSAFRFLPGRGQKEPSAGSQANRQQLDWLLF